MTFFTKKKEIEKPGISVKMFSKLNPKTRLKLEMKIMVNIVAEKQKRTKFLWDKLRKHVNQMIFISKMRKISLMASNDNMQG